MENLISFPFPCIFLCGSLCYTGSSKPLARFLIKSGYNIFHNGFAGIFRAEIVSAMGCGNTKASVSTVDELANEKNDNNNSRNGEVQRKKKRNILKERQIEQNVNSGKSLSQANFPGKNPFFGIASVQLFRHGHVVRNFSRFRQQI